MCMSKYSILYSEHTANPRDYFSLYFNIHGTILLSHFVRKLHVSAQYEKAKLIDTMQILLFFFK
jgi:hypothetical protein